MDVLLGSTPALVIAAVLLIVVASLPSVSGSRARLAVPVCVAAVVFGAVLVWQLVDRAGLLVNTLPSKVLKYAARELNDAREKNVLVVEGASYVLNGVDSTTLADELETAGYSVDVVRIAASAANHFERYRMQQGVLQRLTRRPSVGQRWIYLAEVQRDYDRLPLAQFAKNQDASRTYHYLTLSNAWYAVEALASPGTEEPLDGAWRWPLLRHTLVNSFSAGVASRLRAPDEVDYAVGDVSGRRPGYFRARDLAPLFPAAKERPSVNVRFPWTTKIRERRLRRLWRPYIAEFAYFGVPSTTVEQLEYVRDFCLAVKTQCIAPTDQELLETLDDRRNWRDVGHMTQRGAKIYSRWLARELMRVGLVVK